MDRAWFYEEVQLMSLVIPDDILRAANISAGELRQEIALLLFQQDRLTLGQASEFTDMSRVDFQRLLARHHIPVHYDRQEFDDDLETLRRSGQL
jgi:predicted HTH domain antitoxin